MKQLIITLIISIFMLSACGSSSSDSAITTAKADKTATPATTTTTENEIATQKSQTMLFFLNPNGGPCKRQNAILKGMSEQLQAKHIEIEYVSTQEMASNEPIFRQYGIRALPTIIILDENGAEKKRFSPGVQSQDALLAAIN